ncbi:MAG: rRNA biogenesis protein rrp5 [Caeruleum heppii]|nr:MAG: rRNA biogenesis protein rrp5 [Caeruleum heppii]
MAPVKRKAGPVDSVKPSRTKQTSSLEGPPTKKRKEALLSKTSKSTSSDFAPRGKPAPAVSLVREEEPAFPRGGASILTPLEHKQIKIDATRDVLFEQNNLNNGRHTHGDGDEEDEEFGPQEASMATATRKKKHTTQLQKPKNQFGAKEEGSGVKIEGLSYGRLVPGSMVLGQISQIHAHDIALALPNNLTGYIPLTAISDELSNKVETVLNRADDMSDQEHGASKEDEDIELDALFRVGQFLRARVSATTDAASGVASARPRKHIQLSVNPKDTNSGLTPSDLVVNSMVQAAVISVEDHGLIMDLGLAAGAVKGFMSSKELGYNVDASSIRPGAVFLCLVTGQSSNGKIIKLSADPQKAGTVKKSHYLTDAPTVDAFLPGTAVEFLVVEVTATGLIGKAMGLLDVTADLIHSGAAVSHMELEKRYKSGQKIKARITSTFPMAETKKIGVSLLPHVISFSSVPSGTKENKSDPLEMLPLSSTLEEAKVIKVEPGLGLFLDVGIIGVPAFVHISRIADSRVEALSESSGPYKVGSMHRARIVGFNPMDGLFLASMEERILSQPFLRIEDIKIGQTVKGTIEKLIINANGIGGLLVNLAEGITGLVPDMHMSDMQLAHPERKFKEGMSVKARVLSTDLIKRQMRLSLKKTLVNSDAPIFDNYDDIEPGMQSPGTLVNVLSSGAVVQFYGPVRGFLPVSEMSETYIQNPLEHFRAGQVVNVRVLSVDAAVRRMVVSCKSSMALSQEQRSNMETLRVGDMVSGSVEGRSDDDVTVQLSGSGLRAVLGLRHLTDGSEQKSSALFRKIRVGQMLNDLVVLQKSEKTMAIIVSMKSSLVASAKAGTLPQAFSDLRQGQVLHGFVRNITLTGVFVEFSNNLSGLVLRSQLPASALQLPDFGMQRQQSIKVRVFSLDPIQQRFRLSAKNIDEDEAKVSGVETTEVTNSDQTLINPVDPTITSINDFSLGKITRAKVASVKETQINVRLADNVQGRIDVSEVFDTWDEINDRKRPLQKFSKNEIIAVRILGVHDARNHRFLPITHRAGKVPVFELSAKSSVQKSSELDILTLDKVKVGSSWLAFINNLADDCIWVNLTPNIRGRLRHIDLSEDVSLLKDVERNFPVGSALRVHVRRVDVDSNKLDLSARSTTGIGLSDYNSLVKGMVLPGRVTKVTERQLLVQLSDDISGVVALTDLTDDFEQANPTIYQKNEIVRVCITDLDVPNKKVTLSTRSSRVLSSALTVKDPEIASISQLKVNDIVRGFIKNVADNGVFVSLSPKVTAYIRISDLSDGFIKDWKPQFQIDQLIKGKVIAVDPLLNHLQLSLKESVMNEDYVPLLTFDDVQKGQDLTGKVRKVEDFGVFIVVDNSRNVSGLCHRSEIADQPVVDVKALYQEGDLVKAKVLKVDPERKRISFGLKASYFKEASDVESDSDEEDVGGVTLNGNQDDQDDQDEIDDEVMEDRSVHSEESQQNDAGDVEANEAKASEDDEASDQASKSVTGLRTGGFDWTASVLDQINNERDSDLDHDMDDGEAKRKKRKKPIIKVDRTGDLDANGPQSAADFERLLLTQPSSSLLWLQYMAFHLQLSEASKARDTAERALRTIDQREEAEKLNIWIGWLNLENTYGNEESLMEVFRNACSYNDPQDVHERLTSILIQSEKHEVRSFHSLHIPPFLLSVMTPTNHTGTIQQADTLFQAMTKKFSASPRIWTNYATFLFNTVAAADRARALLPRALQALPPHTHIQTTSQFGALEFRSPAGDPERGRTLFEGLLATFPKRLDRWTVLLDLEMRVGDRERVRALFERVLRIPGLKAKKARFFFKRWAEWEEKGGDQRMVGKVRERAEEFVRRERERKDGEREVGVE